MNRRFRCTFFVILFFFSNLPYVLADEGLWLPILLGETRYERMKELGCKLTPEDIYSMNHSSLKDAVVLFGTGCTGVMVSNEGLLLTNHHCGINNVQNLSSLEHNYLRDGFWAKTKADELPNPSLKVYFLVRMDDVTERVLNKVSDSSSENTRSALIRRNINEILRTQPKTDGHGWMVNPIFGGNQYILCGYEIFSDVRLVGVPPLNIGKFGGDTDNWIWPRHTGDFTIFRVYANKDNKPALFSEANIPYKPKKIAPVSLKGVKQGDFTMILGYPGTTNEYMYSGKAKNLQNKVYPLRVDLRAKRLAIIADAMKVNPATKLQYTAKSAGIANGWKKWQGTIAGLKRAKALDVIQKREQLFNQWIASNNHAAKYAGLIEGFNAANQKYTEYFGIKDLIDESVNSIEIMQVASQFYTLFINYPVGDTTRIENKIKKYKAYCKSFFKNYNKDIDCKTFTSLMGSYYKEAPIGYRTEYLTKESNRLKGDFSAFASSMFAKSVFCDTSELFGKLKPGKWQKLKNDPAVELYSGFYKILSKTILPNFNNAAIAMDSLDRLYVNGLMEMHADKMYPDANQTFRIAFGKVEGYKAADAVLYDYYTTVDGILEKENPAIDDYQVSDVLKDLIKRNDYGEYADSIGTGHKELRVCFAASNHTAGGNSGSPVFNANGELVGLNFDRCWEGTMSDILYDPTQCRNISLDIRYLLFVVDKIAGAGYLLNEMQIVRN
jgi:hypothetical protein